MEQVTREQAAQPLFLLGKVVATKGAMSIGNWGLFARCINRHICGDWGCVSAEDAESNNEAVKAGLRILSAYPIDETKPCKGFGENTLWVITEGDRSVTTFLLPDEY